MDIDTMRNEFLKQKFCISCGSQRCDTSLEWLEGCPKWHTFVQQYGFVSQLAEETDSKSVK